jgi:superoxide dismutase
MVPKAGSGLECRSGRTARQYLEDSSEIRAQHERRNGTDYATRGRSTPATQSHRRGARNRGGNGRADDAARTWLASAFGQFDRWEAEFRRIANGLGGRAGWVILGFNRQFGTAENYRMADHMHSPAMTVPLLVMDMYEHSYHMDFGAAAGQYVDAFFNNINWESVLARIETL